MQLVAGLGLGLPYTIAAADRYEGLAYASGGDELVYRETHWRYQDDTGPARLVVYRCPNGRPFARKRVWASATATAIAPNFEFVDARSGQREGVVDAGGRREAYWQPSRGAPIKRGSPRFGPGSVVDTGFDALIRAHWRELQSGRALVAPFLIPSRLEFMRLRIERVDASAGLRPPQTRLRLQVGAWYGFAVPHVELTYRDSDEWLLRFEGIGTIQDRSGRRQAVRIEFPPRLLTSGVDAEDLESALAMPLAANCDD